MIGKRISHYTIVEKLGEGGMGVVYRAEDTRLRRDVALKFPPADAVGSEADRARFVAEAQTAASLDHPNVCTVYEVDEVDGQLYIAMAFVEGRTLEDRIRADGALPLDEAVALAVQATDGVAAAHEKGIVHGDIKAANIMVTPKGQARVMDFGLAHHVSAGRVADATTPGTVAYASPEQVSGEPLDRRSDVWSLGVTLYEMLTGQLPFGGDYESAIVYAVLNEAPRSPCELRREIPEALERVVLKALSRSPEQRYAMAAEMAEDLRDVAASMGVGLARGGRPAGSGSLVRRVLVAAGVYLGASWLAARLVAFVARELDLSLHLVPLTTTLLVSLLPAVVIVAWFTGRRGTARWGRPEWVGVPVNIAVSIALVVALFSGMDLGAATRHVRVTDEDGRSMERVVPKGGFRKRVAIYPFDTMPGDTSSAWGYAFPMLAEADLDQDMFVEIGSMFDAAAFKRLKESGFKSWIGVPLALERKIANERHMDYVVTGRVGDEGGQYVVEMRVTQSASGKEVKQTTFRGDNPFAIVDRMTVQLRKDMGEPAWRLDGAEDLPVAEMVTTSKKAACELALGKAAMVYDNDWQGAIKHLEAATAADSTVAPAYFNQFMAYRLTNQDKKGLQALRAAVRHSYKMPERFQFIVKSNYYFANQHPDKALAVLEMLVELYPEDTRGYAGLEQIHMYRNDIDAAIADCQKILALDPYQQDYLLTMGNLYERKGEPAKALSAYQRYADANPTNPKSFQEIGDLHSREGDFDKAKDAYNRALLIEPENVPILVDAADVALALGRFDDAESQYRAALSVAHSAEDSVRVLQSLEQFYYARGEVRRSIATMEQRYALVDRSQSPLVALAQRVDDTGRYAVVGRQKEAFAVLRRLAKELKPPFNKIVPYGYLNLYLVLEQPDAAEKSLASFEEYVKSMHLEIYRPMLLAAEAQIQALRGQYPRAIKTAQAALRMSPSSRAVNRLIGHCYRLEGNYAAAEQHLLAYLKVAPSSARTTYELALTYHAMGREQDAETYRKRTLHIWEHADPEFRYAREARAAFAGWGTPSSSPTGAGGH